jgi:hypothetical protein
VIEFGVLVTNNDRILWWRREGAVAKVEAGCHIYGAHLGLYGTLFKICAIVIAQEFIHDGTSTYVAKFT